MFTSDLSTESTLSPNITRHSLNGLPILKIQSHECEAAISLHGGHLLQFKPTGHQDVIWLSKKAIFSPGKAIRGGVPVCWPWFGPVSAPSHGFARISPWQLLDHGENEQTVTIRLKLCTSEQTREIWPHDFSAVLTFTLGATLRIDLEMINTGERPWQWSGALHSYFNIAATTETWITGAGTSYLDSLQNGLPCNTSEALIINQPIDRIYTAPDATIAIHDRGNQRIIHVVNAGHNSAVIWNPWKETSRNMGDMNDDGYETMVCVEATRYAKDLASGALLMPGEKNILSTEISVTSDK
ncbi:D-hexose-6-phosphate mutarotase [Endozoicomonas sp. GU-1]|uniref:D-hexose-6-phosphate mutarotase n=1 Tax=Endozoicomonas sp. GU-1 TaxID=3009078 RepID=UPI0022B2F6E3|nr:D-hexose-6-phosphate mutarotase [Endozoicomonas sp. GU-1]WBA83304.1 D-hexose-6-phosphate mutarotase [Endozoicomonas sp. GU-1]WBA86235.1 D-hexose-6-phosphate mutarotase [Endozoicomonas sp. GU-1]